MNTAAPGGSGSHGPSARSGDDGCALHPNRDFAPAAKRVSGDAVARGPKAPSGSRLYDEAAASALRQLDEQPFDLDTLSFLDSIHFSGDLPTLSMQSSTLRALEADEFLDSASTGERQHLQPAATERLSLECRESFGESITSGARAAERRFGHEEHEAEVALRGGERAGSPSTERGQREVELPADEPEWPSKPSVYKNVEPEGYSATWSPVRASTSDALRRGADLTIGAADRRTSLDEVDGLLSNSIAANTKGVSRGPSGSGSSIWEPISRPSRVKKGKRSKVRRNKATYAGLRLRIRRSPAFTAYRLAGADTCAREAARAELLLAHLSDWNAMKNRPAHVFSNFLNVLADTANGVSSRDIDFRYGVPPHVVRAWLRKS